MEESDLLIELSDVDETMIERVGGKALSLGRLSRAGFCVPDGFSVTTRAYRAAVGDRLDPVLAEMDTGPSPTRLDDIAALARTAVLEAAPSDHLETALLSRYAAMGTDAAVAVRSSATAEDLAEASFAGQQDSFLNVVGGPALLDAVRRCWASLWTDRAVRYRHSNGIDPSGVALAVVVQRMVDAEVAGVLFTADPVTGTRSHTVIDASPGLGEAVVSGAVNPDHVMVDSATGAVLERRIGDKRVAVRSRVGGGTQRVSSEEALGTADLCVTEAQIGELVDLGRRVQQFAGAPQDIEWALDSEGRLWLTQARPITTLYPVPTTLRSDRRVFLCMTLAQGLVRPITPMGLASYARIGTAITSMLGAPPADPDAGPAGLVAAGQRQFVDITPVLHHPRARRLALRVAGVMEARTQAVLERHLAEQPAPEHAPAGVLPTVARVLWTFKLPVRFLAGLTDPSLAGRGVAALERRLRRRLEIPLTATPGQRLDFVERRLGSDTFQMMPRTIGYALGGFAALALARRLLAGDATPDELQAALRGLPHNVTTEMDLRLWALADTIRSDPAGVETFTRGSATDLARQYRAGQLPPVAQQGLTSFLDGYGHRAVGEIDLGVPRWSEQPEHLIGSISNYLRMPEGELTPDRVFARGVAEGETAVVTLVARARRRGRLRGQLVAWALRRARELIGLRESPKFLLVLSLATLRAQLRLVGEAAAAAGSIEDGDDIFWLDLAEARRALNGEPLAARVAERRLAYASELRRRHVPRILLSDGTEPEATRIGAGSPDGGLTGSPASAGIVTAPARVVLDPATARLEPGEILVVPSTDPGWTPLFLTAGGLVMEMGGSNSHGAVVAREYGIPAVVGVPNATTRLHSGQIVTLDGAAGVVLVESDEAAGVASP